MSANRERPAASGIEWLRRDECRLGPSFVDGLASCNQLLLLNNRGIGGSPNNGQPFDIATLAADAALVIETIGLERMGVMGWSMGGFVAQSLALQHPDRVDKLILLSGHAFIAQYPRALADLINSFFALRGPA